MADPATADDKETNGYTTTNSLGEEEYVSCYGQTFPELLEANREQIEAETGQGSVDTAIATLEEGLVMPDDDENGA